MTGEPTPERRALADAYEKVLLAQADQRAAAAKVRVPRPRQAHPVLFALGLAAAGFAGYVWSVRPAWAFGEPPRVISPVVSRAELRAGLYVQAQRIEYFRAARGRLPTSLAELGAALPAGLSYAMADTTFELRAARGADTVVLKSTDSAPRFLGEAFGVLSRRGRP